MAIKEAEVVAKWQSIKNSASGRNIPFTLTIQQIRKLIETNVCYYTGVEFIKGDAQRCMTFDRLDSDGPYSKDNVVVCTSAINNLKSNLTFEEIHKLLDKMSKFYASKYKNKIKKPKPTKASNVIVSKFDA